MKRNAASVAVVVLISLQLSCATAFSPEVVRGEITRQTGSEPPGVFELNIGRMTLTLARSVIGSASEHALPLTGLTRFELAVYQLPEAGQKLDFTRMKVRGWEATVRSKTETGSTLVLVRHHRAAIGDLVLLAGDRKQAVYARLTGKLSNDLPVALGNAVATGGTDEVKRDLMSLAGPQTTPNGTTPGR